MAGSANPDDLFEIDGVGDLYGLDPSEFVAARAALVKALKGAGDKAVAAEVAKLRKPSVVAAAINRIARRRADDVDRLIDASEALADAQRSTLRGGDAAELRAAAADRRRLLAEVAAEATTIAGPARAAEVSATIEAALADEALVADLRRGTLTDTLSAPAGFGFGTDLDDEEEVAAPARRPRATARARAKATGASPDWAAEEKARRRAERERRREAEARLASATKAKGESEVALRAAEAELAAAEEAVALARDRVGAAAARLEGLSADVEAAEAEVAGLPDV